MAVITPTRLATDDDRLLRYQWAAPASTGDTYDPLYLPSHPDRVIQCLSLGSTGQVLVHGSIDNVTYAPITDPQGNALTLSTGNMIDTVEPAVPYIKPVLSGAVVPGIIQLAATR